MAPASRDFEYHAVSFGMCFVNDAPEFNPLAVLSRRLQCLQGHRLRFRQWTLAENPVARAADLRREIGFFGNSLDLDQLAGCESEITLAIVDEDARGSVLNEVISYCGIPVSHDGPDSNEVTADRLIGRELADLLGSCENRRRLRRRLRARYGGAQNQTADRGQRG